MHWDDLKVFLAVARSESLSGAGPGLKMDPATVGRRVQRLEDALDRPLFIKSPLGYALTDAGERLLQHAEAAEAAMRAGAQSLGSGSEGLSGQIRIGAPDGCANYVLPQVCAAICDDNPDLDIQIVALPRVINLSRREADMAVMVSAPTAGQLLVQKITDYKLHIAAARGYLDQHGPIRTSDDLRDHRMLGYIPDMIFDAELDYLTEVGVQRVQLASNSVAVQLKSAARGAGVCVVHDFAMDMHPELRRILMDQISLRRSFFLVRHQSDRRSDRLNRFASLLADGLRNEVARLEKLAR